MGLAAWFVAAGVVFIVVALVSSSIRQLPLTTSMICLAFGFGLGPSGLKLIDVHPLHDAKLLEHLTEAAVIVSLFTAGLKMRLPLRNPLWYTPLRLALVSMAITVGLFTAIGFYGLGLSIGAAVLLGAVLAPTDPVLASDVQLESSTDRDRLRFSLTAEAGLNDGTAFPFVMLGLGLLGAHDIGRFGWRWWVVDLVWAVAAGLAIGGALGWLVGKTVLQLRLRRREALGLDNFLAVGLIALSYGAALYCHAYGFLAVFAAGVALRIIEMQSRGAEPSREIRMAAAASDDDEIATSEETAPAYMAEAVLSFNDQLERFAEVGLVLLLGALLREEYLHAELLWFAPLLLLVVRPVAVLAGMALAPVSLFERGLMGWFGIRGIGSMYYLMYALAHGVTRTEATPLIGLVLMCVTISIVVHGVTVTPLMKLHHAKQPAGERDEDSIERERNGQ